MACKFCEIGAGAFFSDIDRPYCESANYYAISSVGGFVPGWTLIFPKKHALNLSADYGTPELSEFVRTVTATVRREYGQCVHFEHGAAELNSQTGCGVNHAHLHVVPFSKGLESLALASRPGLAWRKISAASVAATCQGSEYLFCSDDFTGVKTTGLLAPLISPESQFFRRLIATSLGLNTLYDYKRYRFEELALSTTEHLTRCFSLAGSSVV